MAVMDRGVERLGIRPSKDAAVEIYQSAHSRPGSSRLTIDIPFSSHDDVEHNARHIRATLTEILGINEEENRQQRETWAEAAKMPASPEEVVAAFRTFRKLLEDTSNGE